MAICIQSYYAVAVSFSHRFGVWSRTPVSTTSRLTVKRSTLSSGAQQVPEQATPTPTSCSPGGKSLTHNSHLVPYRKTTNVAQFWKKSSTFCVLRSKQICMYVFENDPCHSLAFRGNHVQAKFQCSNTPKPWPRCACMCKCSSSNTTGIYSPYWQPNIPACNSWWK